MLSRHRRNLLSYVLSFGANHTHSVKDLVSPFNQFCGLIRYIPTSVHIPEMTEWIPQR